MKKIILLTLLVCFLATIIQAQTISIAISRDTVLLGNRFYVQYTFDAKDGKFIPPDIKGADIIGQNFVSNTSLVNGEIKAIHKQRYLIQPLSVGYLDIPATIIKTRDQSGGNLDVPPVRIYVKQNPEHLEQDPEEDHDWQFHDLLEGKSMGRKSKRL